MAAAYARNGDGSALQTLHNLAIVVFAQGRPDEAAALTREAYEGELKLLGPDHPHTLMSMNNLADDYARRGEYDEAERMHQEVLAKRTRVLGQDHPDTVFSMYGLAQVAARRGDRGKALRWLQQAVQHGLKIADEMSADPALQSLHGEPAFDNLVSTARQNAAEHTPQKER